MGESIPTEKLKNSHIYRNVIKLNRVCSAKQRISTDEFASHTLWFCNARTSRARLRAATATRLKLIECAWDYERASSTGRSLGEGTRKGKGHEGYQCRFGGTVSLGPTSCATTCMSFFPFFFWFILSSYALDVAWTGTMLLSFYFVCLFFISSLVINLLLRCFYAISCSPS